MKKQYEIAMHDGLQMSYQRATEILTRPNYVPSARERRLSGYMICNLAAEVDALRAQVKRLEKEIGASK